MSHRPGRILLVFLDGLGIGGEDPGVNPFLRARLPAFEWLFGGAIPTLDPATVVASAARVERWVAADATLGISGRPQSGTGQTSLLTGCNAAERFGRHFGPWVPTGLRPLLERDNLLSRARRAGRAVSFANAHPAKASQRTGRTRRAAAPPLAAEAAGVLVRHEAALLQGRAIPSSITNEVWRRHLPSLPPLEPGRAGELLSAIAREAELTLFAHYDTDLIGHRRDLRGAVEVLERVDAFLGGLLEGLAADTLLVIASDHGNIEDASVGHTTNPVPVIATGPGSEQLVRAVRSITDVAPALLGLINVDGDDDG